MNRWLVCLVGVTACASTEALLRERPSDEASVVPDAGDGGADGASSDAEGPCADCDYFPDECTPDALCSNGPFDPGTSGGSIDPVKRIMVIRGRSASDVWAAGALGDFDGTSWKRLDPGNGDTLRALWLRDSDEISVATMTRIYTRGLDVDGGASPSPDGWTFQESTAPPDYAEGWVHLKSGWAAPGATSLWGAAYDSAPFRDNGLWRLRLSPSSKFELSPGIASDVCATLRCGLMASIHGASANDLWAVGMAGAAVRITDAESDTPSAKAFNMQTWNALNAVWTASESDAWAVGAEGTIRHYTGDPNVWDVVSDVPTKEPLNAVWGSSPSDVWAVGNAGVVLHYDGASWSRVKIAGLRRSRPNLNTVWVASPGHVWIGGQGVILSLGGKP
jgi:hypothetical protein